ncbi:GntR family transcriptional regulator [Pseudonocardia hydrocarbonoxydans]|uniref:GntR family transcriptional regulator n=1 Tax=Pseudonocardia hydrocarbonoxydans TaxID=76726 RepID=A0A4Y3WVL6_9PSEU|nr:GntR family transcriptional regulator [Pseudonocardia hydrocarbonoxydans]GEC22331.1 GntR family transcriptional regulator [Pseudonocardia hydrocarbonoxydans]
MRKYTKPGEPAYVTMAGHLREQIQSGELPSGAKLPSERELSQAWGVSGIVARQAVATLRSDGLVYGVPGKGVFVTDRPNLTRVAPARYRKGRTARTFVDEAASAGQTSDRVTSTSQIQAPDDVAERLGIEPGAQVSDTEYLISMDSVPVTWSHAYEPLELTGGTEIEWPNEGPYGHLGIADRFDVIGHQVIEVEEQLTFRAPTDAEAAKLQITAGVGVIEIKQTFRTSERAVEVADIVYPANRYRFIYRMPVPQQ